MTLTFEGPISGGDLPECRVLRCSNEGDFVGTLANTGYMTRTEILVCAEHKQQIDSGTPFTWDPDERVLLLEADRSSGGRLPAVTYTVSRNWDDHDSEVGSGPFVLTFTSKDSQVVAVALAGPTAAALSDSLAVFTRNEKREE